MKITEHTSRRSRRAFWRAWRKAGGAIIPYQFIEIV